MMKLSLESVGRIVWALMLPTKLRFRALMYLSAPGPARGRGRWPWNMAVVGALGLQYIRHCPFLPFSLHVVQSQSAELPATTEEEWRRRHSSQGHKAGPLTVLQLPSTTYCCRCFFSVSLCVVGSAHELSCSHNLSGR